MSFLNWPADEPYLSRGAERQRRRRILDLFDRFSRAFPEVTYELYWETPSVNAQAWRLGSTRYVRVYGGLVRHRAITKCGLALMLAHETGHHLGGLPRDPAMPWMTWQGQADYWAASTAMPSVWGERARTMTLRGAREIIRLHQMLAIQFDGDELDLTPECRYRIFRSGALGKNMPSCANRAFEQIFA
jgi:Zn-dependent protease with chaperone function